MKIYSYNTVQIFDYEAFMDLLKITCKVGNDTEKG